MYTSEIHTTEMHLSSRVIAHKILVLQFRIYTVSKKFGIIQPAHYTFPIQLANKVYNSKKRTVPLDDPFSMDNIF